MGCGLARQPGAHRGRDGQRHGTTAGAAAERGGGGATAAAAGCCTADVAELTSLLALDLGRITGWAWAPLTETRPTCDVWLLPASDPLDVIGARVAVLENTLALALERWRPEWVVLAETFRGRNASLADSQAALMGAVRAECWRARVRLRVQPETTVRKEMLGRGAGRTEIMKPLALAWCARQGIETSDHNAADAAVLWRWTREELTRRLAVRCVSTCSEERSRS